jgi:hypothetical protein
MGKMSDTLICTIICFIVTSIFVPYAVLADAKSEMSPLEQYQQYRTKYGKDTAREDMLDNGRIDNSINAVEFTYSEFGLLQDQNDTPNKIQIQRMVPDDDSFVYHWEQNSTDTGSEYSSYINTPITITLVDDNIAIPDDSASEKLLDRYGILLSNEKTPWTFDQSYALLQTMDAIPQKTRSMPQEQKGVTSKWILTDEYIDNDIRITNRDSYYTVEISSDAFESATPRIALVDDKMGKYFSQRLHHAATWFVTDRGHDLDAIEKILNERFGVSMYVPSYDTLTEQTTKEDDKGFQQFHPHELIQIINTFEEMPKGFHAINGLDYLVRRADGTTHPLYPNAPAVSWAVTNPGYIEFMESAFSDYDYLHRLIIHEKAHFLWTHLFSSEIKDEWTRLGGWHQDKKAASGWATTKTTEFVSAYAHQQNPDEDMAESIAYFVINPDKLKSRSLPKYEFIRDRIMEGNIYIPTIHEDLTFDVLNLYPDYIYPGKIIRVDISILGKKNEDKHATVEIELSGREEFEGAKSAYFRLISEQGTYHDVTLLPVDGKIGLVLRGEVTINHNAKGGLWHTEQIILDDQVNNQRFKGQNDFGWKFFVNNENEDISPPSYVKRSLTLNVHSDIIESRPTQTVSASWRVAEPTDIKTCYATIDHDDLDSYSISAYGDYDTKTQTCVVNFRVTEFYRTGYYNIKQILMTDKAGNDSTINFTNLLEDGSVFVRTTNPDVDYPYLDVQNIKISAQPTNPSRPNGETNVSISYYAKDNKSGLGQVSFVLRDPQGVQHHFYHYHKNFHTLFFDGKPAELAKYHISLVLPEGSAPGKWALIQMNLVDKANNSKSYQFVEIMHFEIFG